MNFHYFLLGLFGSFACFLAGAVAREALVGGHASKSLEFMYQVSVMINGSSSYRGCGGGILSNETIITAASCLIGPNNILYSQSISILAGTYDLNVIEASTVIIGVKEVYVPKEFNPTNYDYPGDIAILKLKGHFNLTRFAVLRKLSMPRNQKVTFAGTTATIAGFGWTWVLVDGNNHYGGRHDTHLRYLEAEVLSHEQCELNHPSISMSEKRLCAQAKQYHDNQRRGICLGDGGSPLVYNGIVIGVFSFGPKNCDESLTSGVYTRVSHYLRFIRNAREGKLTFTMRKYDLV